MHEGDHRGASVKESLSTIRIELVSGLVTNVAERGFLAILDARVLTDGIVRNPEIATRQSGRAAKDRFFFDHDYLEPVFGCNDGGGHAARARAGNQQVAVNH